jgi:hypothetical protein
VRPCRYPEAAENCCCSRPRLPGTARAHQWRPRRHSSRLTALVLPLSAAASHPHLSPSISPRRQGCCRGCAFAGRRPRVPPSSASSTPLTPPRRPRRRKRRLRTAGRRSRRRRTTGQAHCTTQLVVLTNQRHKYQSCVPFAAVCFSCLPSDLEGAIRQSGKASADFVNSGGMRAIVRSAFPFPF